MRPHEVDAVGQDYRRTLASVKAQLSKLARNRRAISGQIPVGYRLIRVGYRWPIRAIFRRFEKNVRQYSHPSLGNSGRFCSKIAAIFSDHLD
jgi:hypothetical protein